MIARAEINRVRNAAGKIKHHLPTPPELIVGIIGKRDAEKIKRWRRLQRYRGAAATKRGVRKSTAWRWKKKISCHRRRHLPIPARSVEVVAVCQIVEDVAIRHVHMTRSRHGSLERSASKISARVFPSWVGKIIMGYKADDHSSRRS